MEGNIENNKIKISVFQYLSLYSIKNVGQEINSDPAFLPACKEKDACWNLCIDAFSITVASANKNYFHFFLQIIC